ncbi:vomeronasal type-1 receptor 45-like [Tachyglossus aculeatus]|uniref:vomeronasal type-1 receptor 45-like n=1 Tax=Tachyglossus aculeatus TaxID=9261 RepID=UPI0018F3B0FA|nr:vomeronasal type-1 receptor 45-like [Tachyglossus aculeatus]
MDLVIVHLVLVHTVMLLTRVVTVSASTQHLRLLQTDVGCQTFAAAYRVTRGLSICTTGFMSIVQVMIISPRFSLWAQLKARVQKTIFPIFILLWLLNWIVDINLLFDTIASPNVINREPRFSDYYCSIKPISSLTGVGVMGNSLLISLHVSTILLKPRLKATDLVIVQLAHTAMVLTRMTFAYVYRVTRGPSICTTGLLSTVQAMIISPSSSLWTQLKTRVRKNIFPIFILLWLFNSIVDINLLFNTVASPNVTIHEPRFSDDYCSI